MARSMLKGKSIPNIFWVEVVVTSIYFLNRCPKRSVENMTPYEAWSGRKAGVSHLKVFGCIAYAHVPDEKEEN
jgi:hypothetical protein